MDISISLSPSNPNYGILTCKNDENFTIIREWFSQVNEQYHILRHKNKWTPKRYYIITDAGRFDIGLTPQIEEFIKTKLPNLILTVSEEVRKILSPKWENISEIHLKHELRDYQIECLKQCLDNGRGTIVVGTGGGKTLIMAYLLENFFKTNPVAKGILIVPDIGLVNQSFSDFTEYGVTFKFNKWTGSHELDKNTNLIISNKSIIQSKNSDNKWFKELKIVIIDECHGIRRSGEFNAEFKNLIAPNKFGFTGTLPENNLDKWNIIGKIGDVIYKKQASELRKDKYISNAKVMSFIIDYTDKPLYVRKPVRPSENYNLEVDFLIDNEKRNNLIAKMVKKTKKNTLIIVERIIHGENLENILKVELPERKVYFIKGEVEVVDRDKIKELMEKDDDIVCIAISKIFSTGINIKNIHYIAFAYIGKSSIKIIQTIGRGLRLHKDKDKVVIFDFVDNLKYGMSHYLKRFAIYENEEIPVEKFKILC